MSDPVKIKLAEITGASVSTRVGLVERGPDNLDNPASFASLVQSIRAMGVISPIIVRVVEGKYDVIDGYRRVQAARKVGLTEIDAMIVQANDLDAMQMWLAANMGFHYPTDIEVGEWLTTILEDTGWSVGVMAEKLGLSERYITLRLALAEPSDIKAAFLMALSQEVQDAAEKAEILRGLKVSRDLLKRTARYVVNGGPDIREDSEGLNLPETRYVVDLVGQYYRWKGRKGALLVLRAQLTILGGLKRKIETGQWGDGRDNKEAR